MNLTMLSAATCAAAFTLSTLQADAATSTNEFEFEVVMVAISSTRWQALKYETRTGEAWIASSGKWMPIADTAKIPKGKYVIKMTALSGDWAAIRYEVNTGQSWHCRAGAWVEITLAPVEPIDQSANPTSSDETKEQP
ncbi:MAG: hypothetical protein E4H02_12305 [Lentisphaerales bacterium]|nr:MAG: hypothetical protein E4H02_12305 [Lentisphaerales bacterium]